MTVLKDWVSGAEKKATDARHGALLKALVDLANQKLSDPTSWKYLEAVCVTDIELTETIFGKFYIEANINFVRRWILQSVGKRKRKDPQLSDEEYLTENLPNKVLIRITQTFTDMFYNRYGKKQKELVPENEYEMRICMNHRGGACFGILICDESHPMNQLVITDYIARTDAASKIADKRRKHIPPLITNGKPLHNEKEVMSHRSGTRS